MSTATKVHLVGAGPGDVGLITVKALECIRSADCIIYDALANEELLESARPDAEIIYVGKRAGQHSLKQDEICALLVEKSRVHASICRLKGGDPFVFGRGGEEALYLAEHGVAFEVVPGVTSAIAAPAYAGIPVTDRAYASSFAVITGHEDPAKSESSVNWEHLAKGVDTLVFLMGVGNIRDISRKLIAGGRCSETPVALVRWGTRPEQEVFTGVLSTIADLVEQANIQPPVVTIVGDVVRLRERLAWFDTRPLFGKTVVVTRARAQASGLAALLTREGARVIEAPAIRIEEPEDFGPMDAAIGGISAYDWVVFTSPNGVDAFLRRLEHHGLDIRALAGVEIACIGPKTAAPLRSRGIRLLALPEQFVAEGLVDEFSKHDMVGKRVLIARAAEAREVLPEALERMGASVNVVPAYRMVREDTDASALAAQLTAGAIDYVTFASGGTVEQFVSLLGDGAAEALSRAALAAIGPITKQKAEELGLSIAVMAEQSTIESLVQAVVEHASEARE